MPPRPLTRSEVLKIVDKLLDPRGRYFGDIVIKNAAPGQAGTINIHQSIKEASQVNVISPA